MVKERNTPGCYDQKGVQEKHSRGRLSHVPQPASNSIMTRYTTRWQGARSLYAEHVHPLFFPGTLLGLTAARRRRGLTDPPFDYGTCWGSVPPRLYCVN